MSRKTYYIKQKLTGLLMLAIGIIMPIMDNGNATITLFLMPLGIYLMITKGKIMCQNVKQAQQEKKQ